MRYRGVLTALAWLTLTASSHAQNVAPAQAPAEDPQILADKIQGDVEAIRGLPFKRKVKAANQTPEEFSKYVEREMSAGMPETIARHYGKIVHRLGLYRGPEIQGVVDMMKMVATSQAAAYYDPEQQTFFVLLPNMPEMVRGVFYSHELYHGLQDQYFDLRKFMMDRRFDAQISADELLARQSVVEGEAMYIMTLWGVRNMTGQIPSREMLAPALIMQATMDMETLRASMKQPQVEKMMGDDIKASLDAIDHIPPFIIEGLLGAYLKGSYFVFSVQEKGWSEVEKLYSEYPPESTEQILHPQKWFARESPTRFTWPATDKVRELRDWELLDQNVIGEVQLRHVFKEHGLGAESVAVASGWDGDRYAVYKRKDSDATLLLLTTSWDTEADATEFANAYRRLLASKYANTQEPTRLEQHGKDVVIVEGGPERGLRGLMKYVRSAQKSKNAH